MSAKELVLVDLSSIVHPLWHTCQSDPNVNACSQQAISRVHSLATGHPHVVVCCDSGKSFRVQVSAAYKANRPERDASLNHQMTLAREQLARDGFQVWAVPGFEADDLIAAATTRAKLETDYDVLIVSADKDILQLVGERVKAKSVRDGSVIDADGVKAKFGVRPDQIRDYLCLVGDASDNVKGAKNIGPKTAAKLLEKHETLDGIYDALKNHATQFTPALATSLREFQAVRPETEQLITLRADVEIPFADAFKERVAQATIDFNEGLDDMENTESSEGQQPVAETGAAESVKQSEPGAALSVIQPMPEIVTAPGEWELQLDPRSMKDARQLATDMHQSRMFSAYGNPQAVLSTVMTGRELGLPAMASLRSIHNIDGKHSLSAALMSALVLKSGLAEYFEPVKFDDKSATFVTKRKGSRNEVTMTHTIEMARQAWSKGEDAWMKSGWGRNPTDMLVARATARLARMVYPDLLAGLYTPDELNEIRESEAAA